MASVGWRTGTTLDRLVGAQYGRFNVFQLMRLLLQKRNGARPASEHLRFRADLSEAFPGQEITRLSWSATAPLRRGGSVKPTAATQSKRIVITTPNYCVASTLGPLPEPFVDWVRQETRYGGPGMAAFLDIFNQRINVLRYEQKTRQLPALDPAPPEASREAQRLAALMGLIQPQLQAQIPLPPRAWLALAGLIANCRRSAAVVSQVMTVFLATPSRLTEMVGAWRPIEAADRIALGQRNHLLGQQSLLGGRMWDLMARVRLDIAPVSYARLCQLLPLRRLPPAEAGLIAPYGGLLAMLRLLLDRRYDCEIAIVVDADGIPPSRLTAHGITRDGAAAPYVGLRLGQTAWLSARVGARQVRAVRYLASAYASTAEESAV